MQQNQQAPIFGTHRWCVRTIRCPYTPEQLAEAGTASALQPYQPGR